MEMQEEEHGEEDLEEQEKVMVAFWNSCVLLQLEMAAALFALLETPAQEAVRDALRWGARALSLAACVDMHTCA